MRGATEPFRAAMLSAGLNPPDLIEPGKFHRFPGIDKGRGDDAGWCKLFPDGRGGVFGDFSSGLSEHWQAESDRRYSSAEREAFKRQIAEAKRQAAIEERRQHEEAAQVAADILAGANADPAGHAYAIKKCLALGPMVKRGAWPQRGWTDALLIPIYHTDGRVWTLEAINADGDKDYLKAGKKRGGFYPFGRIRGASRVFIGEGLATVAAVVAADSPPAAAAMDKDGLLPVARAVRELAPDAEIVFIADNDLKPNGGNPGLSAALAAAREIGGRVAIPQLDGRKCDFWDVWHERGADAVREALARAASPPPDPPAQTPDVSGAGDWPEPKPLPQGLPPVAAFDYALLPETLRPWARDICERVQCPPDYVAATIMAGLGTVIGRKLGIRPQAQTDWTVAPNQWALLVGRPGVLKSPAMEAALSPLKRLAAQATECHAAATDEYRLALKVAKLRAEEGEKAARKALKNSAEADLSAWLGSAEPEAPVLRRYIANNSTAEALGELHRQNPNGLMVFRDELVSLLKSLDREDQSEARGFYLTGWNGDSPYTFDRITRGMNLHIPAVCLSLLGSTQPGRIAEYIRAAVRGGSADDGLIQRFGLLVWPDIGGDWRDVDRWPDSAASREAHRVFGRLDSLDPAAVGAVQDTDTATGKPDGLPYLRFDVDGLALFREWRADLEAKVRGGDLHPAMESHLSKYRKLVPSLALALHLADNRTGPVDHAATLQALAWAEYLETHAQRAYASVATPEVSAAKAILQRIRKGDLPGTFASWEVWRPGWALLSDREQVADALRLLVELDWLVCRQQETGGRPRGVYEVNPRGLG
ncbi:putative DNA primase/helicase [Methylomagnum ishizawai]|uniref:Putative DNA primase/helicase n=2 Tax=Methylomagnum ishizawai TaxID=1760988 RepID=A0A1Y6D2S5_9GAMM|nr:putative DNA primase/helicase [Methylomagnum ishizawai]